LQEQVKVLIFRDTINPETLPPFSSNPLVPTGCAVPTPRLPVRHANCTTAHLLRALCALPVAEDAYQGDRMPDARREPNDQQLPADLAELLQAVADVPEEYRARVEPILKRVLENSRRRRKIVCRIQAALNQLRLDVGYLMFDLEATRRERDANRQQLD
jgi:septal ring factor EnvC (AmiA/AmiB activator)